MRNINICLVSILIIVFFSGCSINESTNDQASDENQTLITSTPIPLSSPAAEPTLTVTPEPKNPNEISSFATTIYDKDEHRVNNIKTAAEDLDGTVIKPGEIFSFNDTIGRRSKEKGYEEAPIFVNGEKSKGVGGGVCQVSTTLYNAALEADLKIIERHRHSREVSYVPEGKDAAVVYNSKDLRFKNTKDYPIEIRISVSEDEINVTLNKKTE
ncbi:MAG: VanW family protein [Clostridiaceae bacterium]|nr:VanW family protein [Clostridiaceae bacterium]